MITPSTPSAARASGRISLDLPMFAGASGALLAAHEGGLIQALMSGAELPEEHARRLGLDPRATALVLDVLAALGVAHEEDGRYGAGPALREWDESVPGGALGWLALWDHAREFLRRGEPLLRVGTDPAERERHYRRMSAGSGAMYDAAAAELAEQLGGSPERILDVGAGSGVWSLAMAVRNERTRVVALDLSDAVLEPFTARAAALGLAERAETLVGDVHAVSLSPAGYDRVLIANVLRLEPPERALNLLARVRAAIRPGAELVVVDAFGGGSPERQAARALYRLNLAMRSRDTAVHDRAAVESWIREVGLAPIRFIEIEARPGVSAAIVALAPE
jgi:ubiquinone/menaquinone biosynthesis C-methylase UbiE